MTHSPRIDPSDPYLHERMHKALAEDPRVSESNIRVSFSGGRLRLAGVVTTHARRKAALLVAHEIAMGVEIADDMEVPVIEGPPSVETIG